MKKLLLFLLFSIPAFSDSFIEEAKSHQGERVEVIIGAIPQQRDQDGYVTIAGQIIYVGPDYLKVKEGDLIYTILVTNIIAILRDEDN